MMKKPLLKISRITQLQDARYCAGAGFDVVSFSLVRGDDRKLSVSLVWNIAQWIAGPAIGIESAADSAEELADAATSFAYQYLIFPFHEWADAIAVAQGQPHVQLLLRADTSISPAEIAAQLAANTAETPISIELSVANMAELQPYAALLSQCFVHSPDLSVAAALFAQSTDLQPLGIAFGDEVFTADGALDYDAIEAIVE